MLQIILVVRTSHHRIIDFCAFNIDPCYNIRIDFFQCGKIYGRSVDVGILIRRILIFLSVFRVFTHRNILFDIRIG